jgi:hypothetical protein
MILIQKLLCKELVKIRRLESEAEHFMKSKTWLSCFARNNAQRIKVIDAIGKY